jgi:hypothetical protein
MSDKPHNHTKLYLGLLAISLFLVFNIGFLINGDLGKITYTRVSPAAVVVAENQDTDQTPSSTSNHISDYPEEASNNNQLNKTTFTFIQVTDGCQEHFQGECLLVRSGPGKEFPVVYKLRNGVVLKTASSTIKDGVTWYKITFDEWLRYPSRLGGSWWIAGNYVKVIQDVGTLNSPGDTPLGSSTKEIIVDRSKQKLYAYENGKLFMTATTSTGLKSTPTPRGIFHVYKKTPSRYMQGPLPGVSDQYYDLPGVPWNLYFSEQGAVIHGAYWHNSFGTPYSHGCVNLDVADAYKLYNWAEIGTKVTIQD